MDPRSLQRKLRIINWGIVFHRPAWALGLPIPRRVTLREQLAALHELAHDPAAREALKDSFQPHIWERYRGDNPDTGNTHHYEPIFKIPLFTLVEFPLLGGPLRGLLQFSVVRTPNDIDETSVGDWAKRAYQPNKLRRRFQRIGTLIGLDILALS